MLPPPGNLPWFLQPISTSQILLKAMWRRRRLYKMGEWHHQTYFNRITLNEMAGLEVMRPEVGSGHGVGEAEPQPVL